MSGIERVSLQPGFILHHYPYRDTSRILEVLTPEFGRLGIVARGVRRGKTAALMQPFQPLLLSWQRRSDLAVLRGTEAAGPFRRLQGDALLAGFYLNELLLKLIARHDPHPLLWAAYVEALDALDKDGSPGWPLRVFERDLLAETGYGLVLDREADGRSPIRREATYIYDPNGGARPVAGEPRHAVSGRALLALASGERPDGTDEAALRRLLHARIDALLGGQELRTRKVLNALRQRRPHPERSTGDSE